MADDLAAKYPIDNSGPGNLITPLLPSTRCMLEIDGMSIHGNYTRHLRQVATESDLYTYMSGKHGWDRSTWANVDWAAFRMAARKYKSTEVHLLKLVHDKLPFRSHTSRFQPWIPAHCHYCDHPDTMDHLQCTTCNPILEKFRHTLRETIQIYLDSRRCPRLFSTLFLQAINYWFYAALPMPLATSDVFAHQTDIYI